MKFIFHRNQLRVEKRPLMRPVSQSCHRRSITFPQTVNGQLRNGESFVRFNHPSHVLEAAKCSSTTTLPPVCLTRRADNRSQPVSADDCVTWNVNNNYAVSSPEACGLDCHSERATEQLRSVAPVDYSLSWLQTPHVSFQCKLLIRTLVVKTQNTISGSDTC